MSSRSGHRLCACPSVGRCRTSSSCCMCPLSSGGGGPGHQRSLSEVSPQAQRHDELLVQHAQRRRKFGRARVRFSSPLTYRVCLKNRIPSLQGGFEYKRAIVDCIISIIEENPESKETGLAHLCEFIEDCEHTVLAIKILHLLGKEGPRTPQPSKYIRFIFNRVVLESEAVRAGSAAPPAPALNPLFSRFLTVPIVSFLQLPSALWLNLELRTMICCRASWSSCSGTLERFRLCCLSNSLLHS